MGHQRKNSKKRDDIAKTNSLPPGFIAEYEGEHAPVKVVFLLLDMEKAVKRSARPRICRRQYAPFFDPRRKLIERGSVQRPGLGRSGRRLVVRFGARFSVRAQWRQHAFGRPFASCLLRH